MIIKTNKRYVIASLSSPICYLRKTGIGDWSYTFTEDIEAATKTLSRSIAEDIIHLFYLDTRLKDMELVVVPVEIKYSIIEE